LPPSWELLVVLPPQHRGGGRPWNKDFPPPRRQAGKEGRARFVPESRRCRPLRDDAGGKTGRVHRRHGWRPYKVDAHVGKRGEIGVPTARITRKILMRRKLRGIDEDRDDDAWRAPPG